MYSFFCTGNEDLHYENIVTGERTTIFPNGTLVIGAVSKSDEGLYKCSASNNVGTPLEATMVLRVIGILNFTHFVSSFCHYQYM